MHTRNFSGFMISTIAFSTMVHAHPVQQQKANANEQQFGRRTSVADTVDEPLERRSSVVDSVADVPTTVSTVVVSTSTSASSTSATATETPTSSTASASTTVTPVALAKVASTSTSSSAAAAETTLAAELSTPVFSTTSDLHGSADALCQTSDTACLGTATVASSNTVTYCGTYDASSTGVVFIPSTIMGDDDDSCGMTIEMFAADTGVSVEGIVGGTCTDCTGRDFIVTDDIVVQFTGGDGETSSPDMVWYMGAAS